MMPRLFSPLLLFLLVPAVAGLAQEPAIPSAQRLTLQQAIGIALERNPSLRQNANQVASGEITVARQQANFQPDLRLSVNGSERFAETVVPGDGSRSYETASGALTSGLNLFNGFGDRAALASAEFSLAGLRESLSRAEQTLVFTTLSQALDVLTARDLIGVQTENLEGNRRQLERVEALYQAGNRPVSDLYQQQAETANAELDLLLAERDTAVTRLQLLQTIGLTPTTTLELAVSDLAPAEAALVAMEPPPLPPEGLSQRPDLLAQIQQIEASRAQITQAQAGYWPTLDLSASFHSDYNSLESSGFQRQFFDDNPGAVVGLTLAVPLFDREVTRSNVAQARINQLNAQLTLTDLTLQATAEYGEAVQSFQTARKLIGVTEAKLTAAREALAAMEERYRVGAATLVELTQARAQFTAAGFERVRARYALIRQAAALVYYRGDWTAMRALLARLETAS